MIVISLGSRHISIFGQCYRVHTAVLCCYIICFFIVCYSPLECFATPERNMRPIITDSSENAIVTTMGNHGEGTSRVFGDIQNDIIEGVAISSTGGIMALNVLGNSGLKPPRHEKPACTEQPQIGYRKHDSEEVHWLIKLAVFILWSINCFEYRTVYELWRTGNRDRDKYFSKLLR